MKTEDVIWPEDWDCLFNYVLPKIPFEQNRKRTKDIALRTSIGNRALKKTIFEICTGKSIKVSPSIKKNPLFRRISVFGKLLRKVTSTCTDL